MSRASKKFLYGMLYVLVGVGIVLWVYVEWFKPVPTCFDLKKNQDETDIDCGGGCASCEIVYAKPLKAGTQVKVFGYEKEGAVVLSEVVNPNQRVSVRFVYRFKIYGNLDRLMTVIEGKDSIRGGERRSLFEIVEKYPKSVIKRVDLEIMEDGPWQRDEKEGRAKIIIEEKPITKLPEAGNEEKKIEVEGRVINQSSITARGVKIIAVLVSQFGIPIFASQTLITEVGPLKEKPFVVVFPADEELLKNVDPTRTQVMVNISE